MPLNILHFAWILFTVTLVTLGVFLILKYYLETRRKMTGSVPVGEEMKSILPFRLQAYERLIVFAERIALPNLVMRINRADMTALQLQSALVKTIRDEFEYNLSQQLYISPKSWELVKTAKEDVIRVINVSSGKIPENASAAELSKAIFDTLMAGNNSAVEMALGELKTEVRKLF